MMKTSLMDYDKEEGEERCPMEGIGRAMEDKGDRKIMITKLCNSTLTFPLTCKQSRFFLSAGRAEFHASLLSGCMSLWDDEPREGSCYKASSLAAESPDHQRPHSG